MQQEKEIKNEAELLLGLDTISICKTRLRHANVTFIYFSALLLLILVTGVITLNYLGLRIDANILFILAMFCLEAINYLNFIHLVKTVEMLIDYASKQEVEIESSLSH